MQICQLFDMEPKTGQRSTGLSSPLDMYQGARLGVWSYSATAARSRNLLDSC